MVSLLRKFDPYIGLMLIVVAIAVFLPARGDGAVIVGNLADAGIVFLFFLYGARLSPAAAISGMTEWKLHIAIVCATFVLFPVLGIGMASIAPPGFPEALLAGLVFLCVLPSTVQSSIAFTSIAHGNVPAALCAATLSNVMGVFLSPLLAGWLLHTSGVALNFEVFRNIMLQLLAPFVAGQLCRPLVGDFVQRNKRWLGYLDRGSILLIIYTAFSKGVVEGIWTKVGVADLAILALALSALLFVVLTLTALVGRKVMRMPVENEIVLQFCGSKKSLASGLPMASVLFGGASVGMIVLPLMIFHQIQLIVCAGLARYYAARKQDE